MRSAWPWIAAAALAPAGAAADRREASVHAQLVGGVATLADAASSSRGHAPLGGVAVRASYATHNVFQYDASLALLATAGAELESGRFTRPGYPAFTAPYSIATQLARLDGGVTLRLGVEWIPTIRLAGGFQTRRSGPPQVDTGGGVVSAVADTGRDSDLSIDLVGSVAVGLDHRIDRRFIVGVAVGGSLAVPLGGEAFRTVEITGHAAYYFYPRW